MNREEYLLKLEEELLLTKSKAQVITFYLDALEEIERLNNIIDELEKIINDYQITSKLDSDYELICDLKNKIKELKEGK